MRKTLCLSAVLLAATVFSLSAKAGIAHDVDSVPALSQRGEIAREAGERGRREDRRQDRRQDRRGDLGTPGAEQGTMILAREGASGGQRQRRGGGGR